MLGADAKRRVIVTLRLPVQSSPQGSLLLVDSVGGQRPLSHSLQPPPAGAQLAAAASSPAVDRLLVAKREIAARSVRRPPQRGQITFRSRLPMDSSFSNSCLQSWQ
jgi:hypothetical protein